MPLDYEPRPVPEHPPLYPQRRFVHGGCVGGCLGMAVGALVVPAILSAYVWKSAAGPIFLILFAAAAGVAGLVAGGILGSLVQLAAIFFRPAWRGITSRCSGPGPRVSCEQPTVRQGRGSGR